MNNRKPVSALTPSENGWYEPMTWKAAFYALTTPGFLPVAISGDSADRLLRDTYEAGGKVAGVLTDNWRIRSAATMESPVGKDHPRYYATYSLQITPAE